MSAALWVAIILPAASCLLGSIVGHAFRAHRKTRNLTREETDDR